MYARCGRKIRSNIFMHVLWLVCIGISSVSPNILTHFVIDSYFVDSMQLVHGINDTLFAIKFRKRKIELPNMHKTNQIRSIYVVKCALVGINVPFNQLKF